jgi:glycosidase
MAKKPIAASRLRETSRPILYEVNTRVLLRELLPEPGKTVTLKGIPDALLDEWASWGIDAVWFMGVWTPGPLGIGIARDHPTLKEAYRSILPDLEERDIVGSPYAVHAYQVEPSLGGDTELKKLRARLADRGLALILDFIPNHTARDHPWVRTHPEYYVAGNDGEEKEKPDHFFRTVTDAGERTIAFGRDPGYAGWTDTAQLNPYHPAGRKAMIDTLTHIAEMCDGVRCDMAMLLLKSVFDRTWGEHPRVPGVVPPEGEFWSDAVAAVRAKAPHFLFIAEAYWNLEWDLQQLGLDYTYDKTLYDRLLHEGAGAVRDHLRAEMEYQKHSLRFIENHDEQRAARAFPSEPWQYAAATVIATVPGMVMLHDGQFDGRLVKLPVQLGRRPAEKPMVRTREFYRRLLSVVSSPVVRTGSWRLLTTHSAWHENHTWQNFLAFWWHKEGSGNRFVVINYAPLSGQCYVDLPPDLPEGNPVEFRDLMGEAVYARDRGGLAAKGIYFDLAPYGLHIFEVTAGRKTPS